MIQEIVYEAFGRVMENSNPGLRIPLGFAGGLHDPDLGFVRFGVRDYDPATGRFTAKDPLGLAGGDPDVYGYCLDDPVNAIDPAGLETNGLGVFGSATAFHRQVGGDSKYVWDGEGNSGIAITGSVGGSTDPFGASAGGAFEHTNAKDIEQTSGEASSAAISGSYGNITGSYGNVKGNGYSGFEARVGAGIGLPVEGSVSRDFTYIIPLP